MTINNLTSVWLGLKRKVYPKPKWLSGTFVGNTCICYFSFIYSSSIIDILSKIYNIKDKDIKINYYPSFCYLVNITGSDVLRTTIDARRECGFLATRDEYLELYQCNNTRGILCQLRGKQIIF